MALDKTLKKRKGKVAIQLKEFIPAFMPLLGD